MAAEWHYSKNGQRHGPVSASDLKALAKSGDLLPTDLIRKEGLTEWKPAKNLKGLFPAAVISESPQKSPSTPVVELTPIAEAVARLTLLDDDLSALSVSKGGFGITPKRLAIAVGTIGCLALLWFALFGLRTTTALHAGMIPLKGESDRGYEDNTYVVMRADKTVEKATRQGLIRVEFLNERYASTFNLGENVPVIKLYGENLQGNLMNDGEWHQDMIAIRHVGKDVEMLLQIQPSPIWVTFIKDGEKPGGKWQNIEGRLKHVCEYVSVESTNGGTAVLEQIEYNSSNPVYRRRWYLQQAGGVMRLDIFGSGKGDAAKYWIPLRQFICNEWKGDRSSLTLDEIKLSNP